jgi:hypothetical protein
VGHSTPPTKRQQKPGTKPSVDTCN